MRMNDVERRIKEREFIMMHMHMAEQMRAVEEERLMQRVIEESKDDAHAHIDPTCPDVDNMTYEQLMELGENAGKVSKGLKKLQIDEIMTMTWIEGRTKQDTCTICMDRFKLGSKYKRLKCDHEYHSDCVSEWLQQSKQCPVCSRDAC